MPHARRIGYGQLMPTLVRLTQRMPTKPGAKPLPARFREYIPAL